MLISLLDMIDTLPVDSMLLTLVIIFRNWVWRRVMFRNRMKVARSKYMNHMFFMYLRRRLLFGARLTSSLRKMLRFVGTLVSPSSVLLDSLGISDMVTNSFPLQVSSFPLGIRIIELMGLFARILVSLTW